MSRANLITRLAILLAIGWFAAVGFAEPNGPAPDKPDAPRPAFGGGQGAGGRGEMLLQRFREALTEINLSDDQKTKINEILENSKDDLRQLVGQVQTLEPQERQQKIREFLMDLRDKARPVLTEEQATKLQEKLANLRGLGGGRNGGGGPDRRVGPGQPPGQRPDAPAEPKGDAAQPLRIQATLDRLQESLKSLQLSAEQKPQVAAIVEDGKKQLNELREKMQSGAIKAEDLREQAPTIFAGMRDQLAGVLTRDQQEKLRDAIQTRYERDSNNPGLPHKPDMKVDSGKTDIKPEPKMEEMKPQSMPEMKGDGELKPAPKSPPLESRSEPGSPQTFAPDTGPAPGAPAPQFNLEKLDGRSVQLSAFKGKPLVIEFGSYSSPSFRQRVPKMEELARQYNAKANFLVIYTKEAHPTGGWEVDRNKEEGIKLPSHADLAARKTAAKDAKQSLRINRAIAIDKMDDSTVAAFGAGENSAVVIGRDGQIVARQRWADPFRLRSILDEAVTARATTSPSN